MTQTNMQRRRRRKPSGTEIKPGPDEAVEHFARMIEIYRAVGHPARALIVLRVLAAREEGLRSGEIASNLGFSCPMTSRHLKELEQAILVRNQVQAIPGGRESRYFATRGARDWFDAFRGRLADDPMDMVRRVLARPVAVGLPASTPG